ncbi:MAG: carboxypeptidase regulatory-like domain-containing protein, partial [Proteobacteria bacterium]|nr:carboxypeptidase regulatory-like domain-containing protein [Pseudomonadota bacterium]
MVATGGNYAYRHRILTELSRQIGETCNLNPDPWGNNAGCQGVTINLDGTDGMGAAVNLTTTTDADGDYWFVDLKPGSYTITVTEPSGFFCSDPDPCRYDLTLVSDEISQGNDFGDFSKVDIHAHKFFDLNENGVQDGLERDLEGIEFCLSNPSGPISCQVTDTDGMVWWMDLMPDTYTVTETLPSGFFGTTPPTVTIATIPDQVVALEPAGRRDRLGRRVGVHHGPPWAFGIRMARRPSVPAWTDSKMSLMS